MFRKMSLVGLMIILSASAALCARWGADTVWGGYTKCMIYENTNPKTKINLNAYESITKYSSKGLPICDITYTPDGRVMDSLVFQYFDDGNRKERISYDMNGNVNFKTSIIRNGNIITEQTISYSSGEKIIDKYIAILDERGNIIESSSGREIDRSNENGEKPDNTRMLDEAVKYINFDPFHPDWYKFNNTYVGNNLELYFRNQASLDEALRKIDQLAAKEGLFKPK